MSGIALEAGCALKQSDALQPVTATSIKIDIKTKQRLLPESFKLDSSTTFRQRLSIIDASVANFTPTGALWYFDGPNESVRPSQGSQSQRQNIFDDEALCQSLALILNAYPHFAGRLRLVHDEEQAVENGDRPRCNRVEVWYGDANSPGVELLVATSDARLDEIIARPEIQAERRAWPATDIPKEQAFCRGNIANGMTAPSRDDGPSYASEGDQRAPNLSLEACMIVQLTHLACGGIVIGVKVSHPMADANTLGFFMQEWSRTHEALVSNMPVPVSAATFDPSLLDAVAFRAAKAITEEELLKKALTVPAHRFDWWDQEGARFKSPAALIPEILKGRPETQVPLLKGEKMPWHEWDNSEKVEHVVLRFTGSQLAALRKTVQARQRPDIRMPSTFDILLAHVWSAINRARGYSPENKDGQVHADIAIGLRKRVDPPLPDGFVGSPLSQIGVSMPANEACSTDCVATMANEIRKTSSLMTPDLVAAHIHGVMQELTPQRVWQVFLGRRHVLVTSWVHTGVYKVNFGGECGPRYVHAIMPAIDGCVQIMEGSPIDKPDSEQGNWYDDGVNVNVYLAATVMAKFLKDPDLYS